jgi:hypothetical protein
MVVFGLCLSFVALCHRKKIRRCFAAIPMQAIRPRGESRQLFRKQNSSRLTTSANNIDLVNPSEETKQRHSANEESVPS